MLMLKEKLGKLDDMDLSEIIEFEKQVINSLLSHDEIFKALKKIENKKKLLNRDSAVAVLSEGIDFD